MQQLRVGRRRGHLAVVASCTATKSVAAAPCAMVRNLPQAPDRLERWAERLNRQEARHRLRDLYGGPMWQSALQLEERATALGYDVDLWVVSAGVGLTRADSHAPAYEASFSAGPDQVAADRTGRRSWWAGLQELSLNGLRGRDLHELREDTDQLLLALSPIYLEGLAEQLTRFADDEGVAIMSSHRPSVQSPLSSQGLRQQLGGTQMTLNARAAAKYLEVVGDALLGSTEAHERWAVWADTNRRREPDPRPRLDDEAVREFIRASRLVPPTSRTRLLTELRRSGLACEQARFARLYAEIQEKP